MLKYLLLFIEDLTFRRTRGTAYCICMNFGYCMEVPYCCLTYCVIGREYELQMFRNVLMREIFRPIRGRLDADRWVIGWRANGYGYGADMLEDAVGWACSSIGGGKKS